MPVPSAGDTFKAHNGVTYKVSRVVSEENGGAWAVLSNSQVPPNYHKKIPETKGLEESRFAIKYDSRIPGWVEK